MTGLKRFLRVLPALCAVLFMLSGCTELQRGLNDLATGFEHFGEDVVRVIEGEDVSKASTAIPEAANFSQYRTAGSSAPAPNAYAGSTYNDMAYQQTNGSVEVYPIIGGNTAPSHMGGYGGGYSAPSADNTQATYFSRDSSITIFPLDGSYRPQAYPQGHAPVQAPAMTHGSLYGQGETITHSAGAAMATSLAGATIIYFPHNKTTLTPEARAQVKEVATRYKRDGVYSDIAIQGHASKRAVGSPKQRHSVNMNISMARAYNVSKALIAAGVPTNVIKTEAFGDTKPLTSEAKSRRVELFAK